MRRDQLEHVLRAAGAVTGEDDLVVIGSQAILGSMEDPPEALAMSVEVDLFPREHVERAIDIDGAIGDGSMFHDTFGYYAHGVGPETAVAPAGWLERLVPVANDNTRGVTGWCMEPHDLVVSKLVAGREKDLVFAQAAIEHAVVDPSMLRERAASLQADEDVRSAVLARIESCVGA